MKDEIRVEVGRTLRALQKEYNAGNYVMPGSIPDRDYTKMSQMNWTAAERKKHRQLQNKLAKQRSRVKKMEVVWGLVACIQDLYQANNAYQSEFSDHSGRILQEGQALENEALALRDENKRIRDELAKRAPRRPPSPPAVFA